MRRARAFLAVLTSAALGAGPAFGQGAALKRIGVAASVQGLVRAAPPRAAGRVVSTGKPLYSGERVTTGPDAHVQVMLIDESTFSLGPNSELLLDEFVYDPDSGAGKTAARVTKGAFRFISGRIAAQAPEKVKIALPTGTIGIRGTVVMGRVAPDGTATVILGGPGGDNDADARPARVRVEGAGRSVDLWRPGFGTTLGSRGPGPVLPMPGEMSGIGRDLGQGAPSPGPGRERGGDFSGEPRVLGRSFLTDAFRDERLRPPPLLASTASAEEIRDPLADPNFKPTWEFMRAIGGSAVYSGVSNVNFFNGASNILAPANVDISVDFASRTFKYTVISPASTGGTYYAQSGNSIVQQGTPSGANEQPISFNSLSGQAVIPVNATMSGDPTHGFDNTGSGGGLTTIEFQKTSTDPIGQVKLDLHFDNGSTGSAQNTASGVVIGPRQ
ncbi:MAG TPA: FecR family protein [Elusimicrobiota bacterium]|nr:FecR family protein [Elusimicrobiota bacterium]